VRRWLLLALLVGLFPIQSIKNARFLHENVCRLTQNVWQRLNASSDIAATGLEIASEVYEAAKRRKSGVYIVIPFDRYGLVEQIVS
jgi:hypothetical protein